jgi:NAD/NADP transhydrogenase alpha subunit
MPTSWMQRQAGEVGKRLAQANIVCHRADPGRKAPVLIPRPW